MVLKNGFWKNSQFITMVVIDQIKNGWCHLTSPDRELLRKFVDYMELTPKRFHHSRHGNIAHYDLTHFQRMAALRHGAIPVDSKTLVTYYRTSDPQVVFNALEFNNPRIEARFLKMFEDFKLGKRDFIPPILGGLSLISWKDSIYKVRSPVVRKNPLVRNIQNNLSMGLTYADKDWEKKQKFDQVVGTEIHRILAESIRQMGEATGIPYPSEAPPWGLVHFLRLADENTPMLRWRPLPNVVHEESGPMPEQTINPEDDVEYESIVTIVRGPWVENVNFEELSAEEIGRKVQNSDGIVVYREGTAQLQILDKDRIGRLAFDDIPLTDAQIEEAINELDYENTKGLEESDTSDTSEL